MINKFKSPLSFLFALILAAMAFWPVSTVSAAAQKPFYSTKGQPSFDPVVKKDGSLVLSSYQIIKGVYQTDIMTVSSKGKQLSKWSEKGHSFYGADAKGNDQIYMIDNRSLKAYTLKHKKKWTKTLSANSGFETMDSVGNLYVASADQLKKYSLSGNLTNFPKRSSVHLNAISLNGKHIYQVAENKNTLSLERLNDKGKSVWKKNVFDSVYKGKNGFRLDDVYNSHIDTNGNVYITAYYEHEDSGQYAGQMYAVNPSGKVLWKRDLGGYGAGDIGSAGNVLYYTTNTQAVLLNKNSGKSIKVFKAKDDYGFMLASKNKTVYVMSESAIQAVNDKGKVLWTYKNPKGNRLGTFTIDQKNQFYAGFYNDDSSETVVKISPKGKQLKKHIIKGNSVMSIAVDPKSSAYYVITLGYSSKTGIRTDVFKY